MGKPSNHHFSPPALKTMGLSRDRLRRVLEVSYSCRAFNEFDPESDHERRPRAARFVGKASWSWSPAHNRTDTFHVTRRKRGGWRLWLTGDFGEGRDLTVDVAGCPPASVSEAEAAAAMVVAFYRGEDPETILPLDEWLPGLITTDDFEYLVTKALGGNVEEETPEDAFMEERQERIRALIEADRLDEADRLCQEGLERFPGHAVLWEMLSEIEEARGNGEAAERTLGAAIEANRELSKVAGQPPALDAAEVFLLGKAGRFEEALEPIGRLQDEGVEHPFFWVIVGGEHYRNQEFLEARRAFEKALTLATNDTIRDLAINGLQLMVDLRNNFLDRLKAEGIDPAELPDQDPQNPEQNLLLSILQSGDLSTPPPPSSHGYPGLDRASMKIIRNLPDEGQAKPAPTGTSKPKRPKGVRSPIGANEPFRKRGITRTPRMPSAPSGSGSATSTDGEMPPHPMQDAASRMEDSLSQWLRGAGSRQTPESPSGTTTEEPRDPMQDAADGLEAWLAQKLEVKPMTAEGK